MNFQRLFTAWSIRRKLLLLLLVIFLPILGIIVGSGLNQRRDAILKAQRDASILAQSLGAQQDQIANSTKTMLGILGQLREVQSLNGAACNELFRQLHLRYPFYSFIGAVTPDGNVFAASDPFQPGLNLSDRKHIQDAIKTLDFSVGEYIVGRISKVKSLNFTLPVLDAQKKLVAILIAGFNISEFGRFITTVNLPEGSAVVFTDHQGIRLYRLPENKATAVGKPALKGFFAPISGQAEEGLFEWTANDGVTRINAFKQLRLKKDLPPYMHITVGLAKDRILHAANLDMLRNLSILGITVLLAMSLAWILANLALIQPVNRLVSATQRFGLGEMEVRTGLPHGADELGRLAQSFDDMAALVGKRNLESGQAEEALNKAYAELEGRVQERTAELAASNAALLGEVARRQRAQTSLEEALSLSKATLESTADGILVVNRQGRIVSANHRFKEMWRLPEDISASGDNDQALAFVQDQLTDPEGFLAKVRELYAQPAAESFDIFHFKDGRIFESYSIPQYLDTQIVGRVWSFRNVGARIKAEEGLRHSEEFLTAMFNSIQDGLSVLDSDLNILRVNPAMEKYGYPQPMVGRKCYEVYHSRNVPCEVCPALETLLTGKVCRIIKHPSTSSDIFVEIQTFPLINRTSGQVEGVIEYVRDITETKRAQEERLRLSNLESLATLAGGIAHDFNNILTAILGNIGLAGLELDDTNRSRERLSAAENACLQAQNLAKQLLTFAKGGAPVKQLVAVEKLITESASFTCRGSRVRSAFSFPDNLWPVEADPGQISQVFQNLLINAIQAMPTGGTIKIQGENLVVKAGGDLPLDPGRYLKISVEDQGVGLPADYLPKIFDPYFTTKQKGSGLGLSTAYSIVKNHRGYIAVKSKLGAGAAFQVFLPASDKKMVPQRVEDQRLVSGKGRILVMDDEEMVRQVLDKMLNHLGYEGEFARDGDEAIALFREAQRSAGAFAAVILDLTVPGGRGGKETLAQLLKIDPGVKAIVSSGYSEDPVMANFDRYGFSGIIAKPFKVPELGKVLHDVILGKS
jgi:PAS domain S-box-containing protein